jgi:Zn-dependent M28 family amino/carboxypeptidase
MRRALLACALMACGDDGAMTGPDGGGGSGDGATNGDGTSCQKPALSQTWLAPLVSDVVQQLASHARYQSADRATARTYLSGQLTQMGWTPQLHTYSTGTNLYATIPATNGATQQIVVGAHYDTVSLSPGANDNASGCAIVMAVARYLKDMPCRTSNVIVVFLDQEEEGLVGAAAFASTLSTSNVTAVHTADQIGWDMDGDHRFEIEQPTNALFTEYQNAAQVVGVPVTRTSSGGTDHEAFRSRGFAAVGISEEYVGGDTSPYRHTQNDTYDTIDQAYLQLGAQLVAQTVMNEL